MATPTFLCHSNTINTGVIDEPRRKFWRNVPVKAYNLYYHHPVWGFYPPRECLDVIIPSIKGSRDVTLKQLFTLPMANTENTVVHISLHAFPESVPQFLIVYTLSYT